MGVVGDGVAAVVGLGVGSAVGVGGSVIDGDPVSVMELGGVGGGGEGGGGEDTGGGESSGEDTGGGGEATYASGVVVGLLIAIGEVGTGVAGTVITGVTAGVAVGGGGGGGERITAAGLGVVMGEY